MMKGYETPEVKVTLFKEDEFILASNQETPKPPTGGGGGIVLPDDNWENLN